MSNKSKIEWTDATWSPVVGCSKCSPGCDNCYAERMACRQVAMGRARHLKDPDGNEDAWIAYSGVIDLDIGEWDDSVALRPEVLDKPLHWRKPRRIFVVSMGDLFHPKVPFEFVSRIAATIGLTQRHIYQVLTKRPNRALSYWHQWLNKTNVNNLFQENVHLGVSISNQAEKHKIETLCRIPAAVRWISFEPLLADMGKIDLSGIGWVVVGGESGPGARPMHPDWVRSIRDQCVAAGVPFFFKQWGAWVEYKPQDRKLRYMNNNRKGRVLYRDGTVNKCGLFAIEPVGMVRIGKKKAGCLLDGKKHRDYPH